MPLRASLVPRSHCRVVWLPSRNPTRPPNRTLIFTPSFLALFAGSRLPKAGCPQNGRILLANLLQSSNSTFSCIHFRSFFAFQAGMWDPRISALLSSPTVSGRYFYRTLYGHHRHACRLSNPRGQQAGHRPSCAMRRDRDVGRKSRARYHVQHPDNIGITQTPVCSRGAAVHDAMAKAHALDFVRQSVTCHARSRAGLAAPCCPAIHGAPTGVLV